MLGALGSNISAIKSSEWSRGSFILYSRGFTGFRGKSVGARRLGSKDEVSGNRLLGPLNFLVGQNLYTNESAYQIISKPPRTENPKPSTPSPKP